MAESIKFFEIKGMGKPRGKAFDRKNACVAEIYHN